MTVCQKGTMPKSSMPNDCMPKDIMPKDCMPNKSMPFYCPAGSIAEISSVLCLGHTRKLLIYVCLYSVSQLCTLKSKFYKGASTKDIRILGRQVGRFSKIGDCYAKTVIAIGENRRWVGRQVKKRPKNLDTLY